MYKSSLPLLVCCEIWFWIFLCCKLSDIYFVVWKLLCFDLNIIILCNNLFIHQVLCTLIYRRRSLYSFLLKCVPNATINSEPPSIQVVVTTILYMLYTFDNLAFGMGEHIRSTCIFVRNKLMSATHMLLETAIKVTRPRSEELKHGVQNLSATNSFHFFNAYGVFLHYLVLYYGIV